MAVELRKKCATDDDDRIYEEIEAPKFVDFSAPDKSLPDDRSWFCARIGCDQLHEEVDPDALHKSFVLRVLAARSPNIRFQKTLSMQAQSRIAKCPLTAPVKSAKDGVQKLSSIASIPERIKAHPISSLRSNPVVKETKQSTLPTKTFTSPLNKKCCLPGEETSRIVQNKVSAKTLVFHSVKKVNNSSSKNCPTPVSGVCAGLKKLHIGCNETIYASQKPCKSLKGSCKVPPDSKSDNAKSARKGLATSTNQDQSYQEIAKETCDMEIDGKSRNGSFGALLVPSTSTIIQGKETVNDLHLNDAINSGENSTSEEKLPGADGQDDMNIEVEARDDSLSIDDEKENASTLVEMPTPHKGVPDSRNFDGWGDEKENGEIKDNSSSFDDDKENASAAYCRKFNTKRDNIVHGNIEYPRKAIVAPTKTLHEAPVQQEKFKRMKATNPKPFRFRTDERGILKEANLERRLIETTSTRVELEKSAGRGTTITPQRRKHLENSSDTCSKPPKKMMKVALSQKPLSSPSNVAAVEKLTTYVYTTPTSWTKKPSTIPRGPNFHRIHVPKGCTKRLESVLV